MRHATCAHIHYQRTQLRHSRSIILQSLSPSLLPFLLFHPPSLSPLKVIKPEMKEYLQLLKKKVMIGIVGGSDMAKQVEQMGGDDGEDGREKDNSWGGGAAVNF